MKLSFVSTDNDTPAYEVLAKKGMSRLLLKRIRLYGQLLVNHQPARMKDPLYTGDIVEVIYKSDHLDFSLRPNHQIHIYYEDEWFIVCEKPAGLVTHPSWQHMDDSLITRLSENPLHPVMRLDRETSGLIVIAKNGFAHHAISTAPMKKEYLGILYGSLQPEHGTIDAPVGRSTDSIMLREVRDDGRHAVTHYKTEINIPEENLSLVRFKLETGRCHQIRVHCLYKGHPLVGDGLYGIHSLAYPNESISGAENDKKIQRQALHAANLSFIHPISQEELSFESPLPDDMRSLMARSFAC